MIDARHSMVDLTDNLIRYRADQVSELFGVGATRVRSEEYDPVTDANIAIRAAIDHELIHADSTNHRNAPRCA